MFAEIATDLTRDSSVDLMFLIVFRIVALALAALLRQYLLDCLHSIEV